MKRLVTLGFLAAILGLPARAVALELGTPATEHPFRSQQNFALEFKFGPYTPSVDDEPSLNGKTPFKDSFGDNPRVFIAVEFDWQVLRIPHVGTVGPGVQVGRASMSRPAYTKIGHVPSGDDYSLTIIPVTLSGVLRADVFWRDLGIPLVPYGKLGIGDGIWHASNGSGTSISSTTQVSGKGMTWGTNVAVGVAVALDRLDAYASRNMDNETGINSTYLFAEGYWLGLNGIGQTNALRVGTTSWTAGLAFEF